MELIWTDLQAICDLCCYLKCIISSESVLQCLWRRMVDLKVISVQAWTIP
jgi:hypothetical protein